MNGHIEEITYEYDSEGRINEKYISEDCPEGHSGFYSYEYNADGKLERIEYRQNEDDEGETVYECDYDEDGTTIKDTNGAYEYSSMAFSGDLTVAPYGWKKLCEACYAHSYHEEYDDYYYQLYIEKLSSKVDDLSREYEE